MYSLQESRYSHRLLQITSTIFLPRLINVHEHIICDHGKIQRSYISILYPENSVIVKCDENDSGCGKVHCGERCSGLGNFTSEAAAGTGGAKKGHVANKSVFYKCHIYILAA